MPRKLSDRPRVFLSYSHRDRRWADRLLIHLRTIAPDVDAWSDADIGVGASWSDEIREAISAAEVAILMVSANYLASAFIVEQELPALLESAKRGDTLILPVVVSPVLIEGSGLEMFQFVNSPDRPLNGLKPTQQERIFVAVAQAIERGVTKRTMGKIVEEHAPKVSDNLGSLVDEIAAKVVKLLASDQNVVQGKPVRGAAGLPAADDKLVFVVMSFADDMEPVFDGIAAAAASVGLEAKRVKDIPGDYRITDKIMEMILSSRIVVADLTHERPNVYFELGYARGLGKTIITVARRDTQIHFDVKDWTYIPYIDSRILERDLKERLKNELQR